VLRSLRLTGRVFDVKILIGEEDGHVIRGISVQRNGSVRLNPDSQNPHLWVFKLQLVVGGIYFERIVIAGDRLISACCLHLDLDDVEVMIEDRSRMHPSRWTPQYLACLEDRHSGWPSILILEPLLSRLEVDHHAVHLVLVELSLPLGFLKGAGDLHLIIVVKHR